MSVEFEPVKLGPRRGRLDPVAIGSLVVAVGLLAALIKPWASGAVDGTSASPGIAAASGSVSQASGSLTGPHATASIRPQPLPPGSTSASASWPDVRAAIRPHDTWGIRAIVEPAALGSQEASPSFGEHWDELPERWPGSDTARMASVDIQPNGRTVVAIGITFPASHTPLDTRIWLVHPDRLEWVDARAMGTDPAGGAFLYQVLDGGGSVQNWDAGRYRVDVLVDGVVHRFGFTLPNRFEIVPDRPEVVRALEDLIGPEGGALPSLPVGLFATAVGASIPLAGVGGPALDEAGAWLNVDSGTGRAPRSFVSSAFISWATGLGVTLPPGSVVQRATLRRLAPEPLGVEAERVDEGAGAAWAPTSSVLYRAPGGGVWLPGVYQISVSWSDSNGVHDQSWHVELRPGAAYHPPSLLLAARAYARYAGASGVVLGTTEPLEEATSFEAIRLVQPGPFAAAEPTGVPLRDRVPCAGVRVGAGSTIVGVAHPVDTPPARITVRSLFEFSASHEQPVLTAERDVPGLTLVAPLGAASVTSSPYRLRISDDMAVPGATVCLAIAPVD